MRDKLRSPQIYESDTFVVSYPKSGNTWVRFLLSNLIKKDENEVIDFNTAVKYIPEFGVHDDVLSRLRPPRIIKSHQVYNPDFPRVIYLVRDPRDVYVSYYHYSLKKLGGLSFSGFLRKSDLRPCRWHEHVISWIGKPNVKVFKYEDLLEDTKSQLMQLCDFVQVEYTAERLQKAIESSSFGEMKRLEKERGRPFKDVKSAALASPFMRKGVKGDWVNFFNEEDLRFLISEAGSVMRQLGYIGDG